MYSPTLIARVVFEVASFKKTLEELLNELSLGQSGEASGARKLATFSNAAKGVLGGIHYELARASFGKLEAQILSSEALMIVSAADDFIDETGIKIEEQIAVILGLLDTIKTGKKFDAGYEEIKPLSLIAQDINKRIFRSPYPLMFIQEYESLAEAATQQIQGKASLDLAQRIGGGTMALSAVIPYCFDKSVPERMLKTARLFGGYFQILDDIWDFEHDSSRGISTVMTIASNPDKSKSEYHNFALALYQKSLSLLKPNERQVYSTLNFLFHIKWFADKYLRKPNNSFPT